MPEELHLLDRHLPLRCISMVSYSDAFHCEIYVKYVRHGSACCVPPILSAKFHSESLEAFWLVCNHKGSSFSDEFISFLTFMAK